ncbi:ATP-binding cassette domain-containing protein, partial [Halomonas elongata]|uniref:ATP-binding cassette domain-containing protein n=1 Tax=Halomonas elongata TaxID=2746 RepID=UPI00255B3B84
MSISSHENAIEPILHAEGLTQQVVSGERHLTILKDLNLAVLPGESLAILGQSGAGKSTLLGLLAGLDAPSAGRLAMFGQALNELDEDGRARLRAGRVGFVFQNFQLLPTLTALENVRVALQRKLGTSFHFWKSEKTLEPLNERAMALLEEVDLQDYADVLTVEMPYGRKRALEVATTLALEPSVMLL